MQHGGKRGHYLTGRLCEQRAQLLQVTACGSCLGKDVLEAMGKAQAWGGAAHRNLQNQGG